MTTTASQVWSRAIARAHGSVSFAASIRDIAVILPHLGASGTIREKPSAHDLRPQSHPFVKGMSHKQSVKLLRSDLDSSCRAHFADFDHLGPFIDPRRPDMLCPCPARKAVMRGCWSSREKHELYLAWALGRRWGSWAKTLCDPT